MLAILRTTSEHQDFIKLTALFDEYLIDIDGEQKDFYASFNQIPLENVALCFENQNPIGCGAFKKHQNNTVELKRMFVDPNHRGKGAAKIILQELEKWSAEFGTKKIILETSIKLEAAINLYSKSGYFQIDNYDQYIGVADSYCMQKII